MSGPPATFSEAPSLGPTAPSSDMAVPAMLLPFKRSGTDIVERQLDIFPYPNANVTSQNASQILRFDFPPSVMLDCTQQGLELDFQLTITASGGGSLSSTLQRVQPFPGECFGHLVNTIRVFINNEMVEETLNFGQLSSIMQQITTNVTDSSCYEQNIKGRYSDENSYPYEIRKDGELLTQGSNIVFGTALSNGASTAQTFSAGSLTSFGGTASANAGNQSIDNQGAFFTSYYGSTQAAATSVLLDPSSIVDTEIAAYVSTTALTLVAAPAGAATFAVRAQNYKISGLGYNIPQDLHANSLWFQKALYRSGVQCRMPLAIPGQFFNQRQGLIPLHRLPKVRMEITFNPSPYVLFGPSVNSTPNTSANFNACDYQLSNMRISAMYAQSPSLVSMYDAGNWNYSFLGYNYYTAPVGTSGPQFIPISMPFKSSRWLLAVIVNPGQYTGFQVPSAPTVGVTANYYPFVGGVAQAAGNLNNLVGFDATRWSNWYGLGGCYGGPQYWDNTSQNPNLMMQGTFVGGSQITQLNFQQNNEWIYQQDLQYPTQLWRELSKILPAVKRSTFFTVVGSRTVRQIIAINLETPELSDQFICGNRAAQGQSLGYIKLGTAISAYATFLGGSILGSSGPQPNTVLQCWVCYDRVVKVQERSGLTVVDY